MQNLPRLACLLVHLSRKFCEGGQPTSLDKISAGVIGLHKTRRGRRSKRSEAATCACATISLTSRCATAPRAPACPCCPTPSVITSLIILRKRHFFTRHGATNTLPAPHRRIKPGDRRRQTGGRPSLLTSWLVVSSAVCPAFNSTDEPGLGLRSEYGVEVIELRLHNSRRATAPAAPARAGT